MKNNNYSLTVDFNDATRVMQVVHDNLHLKVPIEKTRVFKLKKTQIKGHYWIGVSVKESGPLVLEGAPILFKRGTEFVSEYELELEKGDEYIPIDLYFDPMKVVDCKEILDKDLNCDLEYEITLTDKKDDGSHVKKTWDNKVSINFKAFHSSPVFSIRWEGVFAKKQELTYIESSDRLKLGKLVMSHNSRLACAPSIKDIRLCLSSFKGSQTDHDYNLYGLSEDAGVSELRSGGSREFALEWKQENSFNPIHEKDNKCRFALKVDPVVGGRLFQPVLLDGLTLLADKTMTKADCYLNMPTSLGYKRYEIDNYNAVIDYPYVIDVSRQESNANGVNTEQRIEWHFGNQALVSDPKHPDAKVMFWDIQTQYFISREDQARIKLHRGKSLHDIFTLADENGKPVESGDVLRLGVKQSEKFVTVLKAEEISDILPSKTTSYVQVKITANYKMYVDLDGEYSESLPVTTDGRYIYSATLNLRIRMKPREKWLSIDFGTSAVVAHYGEQIIDLKRYKDTILKKAYPGRQEKWLNDDETENMIASTVCFNQGNGNVAYDDIDTNTRGNLENFSRLPLWFSPSQGMIDYPYQLPCLKLLIGYKTLPKLFSETEINRFNYYVNTDGGLRKTKFYEDNKGTALVRVSTIFKEVYRQLFHYYICRTDKHFNRLVLSVPNTYSPVHIDELKHIAQDVFPGIYPEYLTVVSESDAVAYYYIANRSDFYRGLSLRDSENVLIYDMGAGTLDITYLSISKGLDDNVTVNTISRIGVPKAGNYLDYVLAEIFVDLLKKGFEKATEEERTTLQENIGKLEKQLDCNKENVAGIVSVRERSDFRDYLRNKLKPRIGNGADYEDCPEYMGCKFVVGDFVYHQKFKAYIEDVTDKVLDNFVQTLGKDEKEGLKIDTVIFSGRSSSLIQVRKAVKEKIGKLTGGTSAKYADITSNRLFDDPCDIAGDNITSLKDVVTKGAHEFASTFNRPNSGYILKQKPYYASFGIIARDNANNLTWHPLLEPYDIPEPDGNGSYHGEIVLENVARLKWVDFVQTYSSDPVKEYGDDNKDSITVLHHYPLEHDGNLLIALDFAPDSARQLTLTIGPDEITLNPYQDFNNKALKRSLWPIVFYSEE